MSVPGASRVPGASPVLPPVLPTILSNLMNATRVFTQWTTRIASRTLGQVQRGHKIASDAVCCLDKTWSILDLALGAIAVTEGPAGIAAWEASPSHVALSYIDEFCQLGSCGGGFGGRGGRGGFGGGSGGGRGPFAGPARPGHRPGHLPDTIEEIFADPYTLWGHGPDEVEILLGGRADWFSRPSGHTQGGAVFYEMLPNGQPSGRQLRFSNGGTRPMHPRGPHWKVCGPNLNIPYIPGRR